MSKTLASIVGGTAGAVVLAGMIIVLIWFYLCHYRSVSSETGSSDPSQVRKIELPLQDTRCFEMEELSLATKEFSERNLIGDGKFGEVYRGLLQDGVLVAIKRRHALPSKEFVDEVRYLSSIHHRNVVTLLGYCQENNLQFLIYEYVPNGSVASHLYGVGQQPHEKLQFKLRLSIALGAAKGLAHLHCLSPHLIHKNFKTANVLVDENFIAKVADAGLHNIFGKDEIPGPSSQVVSEEIFLAPEVKEFRQYSEKSDVYSFGVFLLELLSGKEATESQPSDSYQNLVELVQSNGNMFNIIDQRLGKSFTAEGVKDFMQLIVQCINLSSEKRLSMSFVVIELDQILEKEMKLTTSMGEGTPTVTLGSQLFKTTR
ncbi:hypothetical protein VNO78_33217 [Psophocarpus tetragonolobus]|uniref:non-specific serine/threonine protein kinase n=1 Tax=Psophocarpus tetragonolobus TaxID=3891 RepID=A0AAN9RQK0_PSOTE